MFGVGWPKINGTKVPPSFDKEIKLLGPQPVRSNTKLLERLIMNFLDEQIKVNPGFLDDSIIYDDPYLRSTNLDDVAILNDNETIEEAKVRIKNQAF